MLVGLFALPLHAQSAPAGTRPSDSVRETTPLMQAEDALAAQDFARAKTLLLPLTAQPGTDAISHGRAFYDLGYADEALRDDTAAEAAYRSAIAADPKQFEAHAALGLLLLPKDKTEARKELIAAAALTPAANEASARAEVARALAHIDVNSNPEAAREEILAAIKLTDETLDDTLLTAQIAEQLSDFADAESTCRRALDTHPDDPDAVFACARLYIHEARLPQAQAILEPALKAHPDASPLSAQLARVYMLQGASDKALPLLEGEHTRHLNDASITRMLADICARTGNAPRADALYQTLLAKSPDDIGLLIGRGDSLIQQKRFAEAQAVLQHADVLYTAQPALLPATDDRVQLTGELAFAASENGQPAVVLATLDQRLQFAEETPATLFLRATAHDHLHHTAQARAGYTQFLAAAQGKFPDEEWEARHRLVALAHEK